MKIVHISTYLQGGAGIAALRLHQSLMKEPDIQSSFFQKLHIDDDVFLKKNNIYTSEKGTSFLLKIREKYNLDPEYLNWMRLRWHRRIWNGLFKYPVDYEIISFPQTSYRLEELPIIQNADIIHLHWIAEFLNYPTFFKNIKQPIVWTLHDMNPFMGLFHYEGDSKRNQSFRMSDKRNINIKQKAIHQHENINIVCLSEWMKRKSQSSEILKKYPHSLIPNGLDLGQFPLLDQTKSKEEIGVNNGLKTILFVASGLNIHRKGFDLLLEAINKIERIDYNLISVGDGELITSDKINNLHYKKITDINLLNKLYTAADVTIIPSREDNLPNVMLESFANGTPVISFSNGGMAEHVKTGETGILINDIGVEYLVKGINDFLDNKYIFDREVIREYAKSTFANTLQTERYIQLYNSILNK